MEQRNLVASEGVYKDLTEWESEPVTEVDTPCYMHELVNGVKAPFEIVFSEEATVEDILSWYLGDK